MIKMIKKSVNLCQLSDSTYAFIFPEYEDLGNAGIVETDDGFVVIDNDVRTVDQLLTTLPQIADKPVKFVINSHHAFDHSSANCILAGKGATIIASERCREEMIRWGEENFKLWSVREPYIKKILEEKGITVALPHITFDHELHLDLGGERIELYYYGHAHTPGDCIVYLPQNQILFGGDILWFGFYPNVKEANVQNLIKVAGRILEFQVKYYIPGHGHITSDKNEVVSMRDFLAFLSEKIGEMVKAGKSFDEVKGLEGTMENEHQNWRGRRFLTRAVDLIYKSLTAPVR
jgi:glyoxylase-like metal-dependent hydrolase (beta-lactamase superfamily II)